MEVSVPYTPASQDHSKDGGGSAADPCESDDCNLRDLAVNDLETCLSESPNIKGHKLSTSSFYQFADNDGNVVGGDKQDDCDKRNSYSSASEKSSSKSATFLLSGDSKSSVDRPLVGKGKQEAETMAKLSEVNGCGKSENQHYTGSISLPNSSSIVSAMKGSREKQGIEPKKLSVTWAPDVYDPVPTAASHVPSNKNQRHRNDGKRYGKTKLKGGSKSSRGSKGKDKKQVHKNSGGNKVKPIHADSGLVGFSKPVMGIEMLVSGVHTPSMEVVF
ncbi:hypothetical protein F511_04358 [Dorcoceras hygrometricum]|uniref:Uncharacterized protein n=1 Tax=Dorcoceras hygrometricum TaxID=472368 RepID=A0A2Z7BK96_9LAMI|nr:hypothetical protein F511_04358 [Dorcoceras hygrometricum]